MSFVEMIALIVVAGICGGLAQAIAGFSRGGCLVSITLGYVGVLLGTWIARKMGLPELPAIRLGGQQFPILWSISCGRSSGHQFLWRPSV